MNQTELEHLLLELTSGAGECEWIEYKVNNWNPEDVGEYISALSNSACYNGKKFGYLVFGVEDKTKKLVGTTFLPFAEKRGGEELLHWWVQRLRPRVDFKVFEFLYLDRRFVIFRIDATQNEPCSFINIAHIRVGSYKRHLQDMPGRARKIWSNADRSPFEYGVAMEKVTSDEVLNFIDYPNFFYLTKQKLPVNKAGILDRLVMEKIIISHNGNYNITNMGALLFGRDTTKFDSISRKSVRVVVWDGVNKIKPKKKEEISGKKGYAIGFQGLLKYILEHCPSSEIISSTTGLRREFSYPEIAVRELVANAIVHQDFSISGASPMIDIFTDRIEITNPGKPLIDTARFIDHSPESRNEKLARFMTRLNICEERGSGIDKVIFECEINELPPPDFIAGDSFTRAILYAYKPFSQLTKKEKIRACFFHSCLKQVSGQVMTNQSLRERFKIEERNSAIVSRIISEALEANVIKDDDPDSNSRKFKKYVPFYA